jgi:hypothetical protein
VTVVAPTAGGGQVTASGCSTVIVAGQPTLVTETGAPCPLQPYRPYQPYMAGYDRPRYARDPDRTAALIGASVGFGVGTAVAGIMYLVQQSDENDHCGRVRRVWNYDTRDYRTEIDNSKCGAARASLLTYGAIVTFTPSLPRFVVGDTSKALIYSGIRAASFATAALVDWGENDSTKWQGPFLLGFAVPVTLGIIDLATTPHREDLEEEQRTGIRGVGAVPVADRGGRTHGAMVSVEGRF